MKVIFSAFGETILHAIMIQQDDESWSSRVVVGPIPARKDAGLLMFIRSGYFLWLHSTALGGMGCSAHPQLQCSKYTSRMCMCWYYAIGSAFLQSWSTL